ncbi:histone H1 [Lentinula edodes]|uniref:Histone H1 n=1 Tax=Lentinula edodes TaxID=5353 RepID=A0A1Q3EML0_LENED|nr:histone H1 [Lentinula edodes]
MLVSHLCCPLSACYLRYSLQCHWGNERKYLSTSKFLILQSHMAVAKKNSTTKSKTSGGKLHPTAHPTWIDMIKECIVTHPEEARTGVSRPTIKNFVEIKYRIDVNPSTASQLNRAITSGSEKGIFVLPKGPSGKVKLAPKVRHDAAKENATPAARKPLSKVKALSARHRISKKVPSAKAKVIQRPASFRASAGLKLPTTKAPTTKKYGATKKYSHPRATPSDKHLKKSTTTARKPSNTKKVSIKKVTAKKPAAKASKAKSNASSKAQASDKPKSSLKATARPKPATKKATAVAA